MELFSYIGQSTKKVPSSTGKTGYELGVNDDQIMSWTPIRTHPNAITENAKIPASANAISSGPITIQEGYEVTIEEGATWTIV